MLENSLSLLAYIGPGLHRAEDIADRSGLPVDAVRTALHELEEERFVIRAGKLATGKRGRPAWVYVNANRQKNLFD